MRSVPVLVEIGHLAGYKALNAHAGRVGDGDVLFVKHGTAEDVVLAAEHRAVKVDLGDDLLGAGQLHGGVDRDLCFQHTADHALHAVHLSGGGNAQGIGDAAALHQLDVHQVGRAGLHDPQGICRAEHALVGQHGHIGMAIPSFR